MKNKLKSKGFWMSVVGAVIVFIQTLGVRVDVPYVNEVVSAACALLVVLGIIVDDMQGKKNGEQVENESDNGSVRAENIVEDTTDEKTCDKTDELHSMKYITDHLE